MNKRKIQIGVMGSAADLDYKDELEELAQTLGREIAKRGRFWYLAPKKITTHCRLRPDAEPEKPVADDWYYLRQRPQHLR